MTQLKPGPELKPQLRAFWLLLATLLVAVAGLIYELIIATSSSFLVGDSIRQFSLVIGIFLTSMGAGAWLSKFVKDATKGFIWSQSLLALIGGFSAPILFLAFGYIGETWPILCALLIATGALSGAEIPLITRVLGELGHKKFSFENVLSLDYLGALAASLLFPFVVLPVLGLIQASLVFGLLNLVIAGASIVIFWRRDMMPIAVAWTLAALGLIAGLVSSDNLIKITDSARFEDNIIFSQQTEYQKIVVTQFSDRTRLYLNDGIQFDSLDEYRYHEALVHPPMAGAPRRARVLVLGGGDGMAVREVLKYTDVKHVDLVDLDPAVTQLFRENQMLARLNDFALRDERVKIINRDAWNYVDELAQNLSGLEPYDIVIADLPDPKDVGISKLYSVEFYNLLSRVMSQHGVLSTHAGSPIFATKAYWSIEASIKSGFDSRGRQYFAHHHYVPSFGQWGFIVAAKGGFDTSFQSLPNESELKYFQASAWQGGQHFGVDVDRQTVEPNRLTNHLLVGYYLEGWAEWFM